MTDHRCAKCEGFTTANVRMLCGFHQSRLTSVHAQVALAQRGPITLAQRDWLFEWFLKTKYFAFHRRMSRGRAKKLLQIMGGELNPANVSIRGPHDLVTDAAQQDHTKGAMSTGPEGISPLGSPS